MQIDILVEDLGLTAVRSASICRLTHSEKQRLNVACQLLTQCSVLVLDQTTTGMDIFDTFFLVEYLRQWCSSRICIMTLQPPTFEILSMCSGVLLLSGGRTIFSGSRADLPRHMGQLGYPCPPFKNPADYYRKRSQFHELAQPLLTISNHFSRFSHARRFVSCSVTRVVGPHRVTGECLGPNEFGAAFGSAARESPRPNETCGLLRSNWNTVHALHCI